MTNNPNYIRVAANVYDSYSTITDIYSVAFKTNVDAGNVINFVNSNKNDIIGVRRMFNPIDGSETTSAYGQYINVMSYNTIAYESIYDTSTSNIAYDQEYYTYVYTKNASSYERVQSASSTIINSA